MLANKLNKNDWHWTIYDCNKIRHCLPYQELKLAVNIFVDAWEKMWTYSSTNLIDNVKQIITLMTKNVSFCHPYYKRPPKLYTIIFQQQRSKR
uniref:Uncharacterized protein n=1 Tax=Romanomermis culicivorax TaxID=13658 RepID=A0A915IPH4_ROMCU